MEATDMEHDEEARDIAAMEEKLEEALAAGHAATVPLAWENYVRSLFLLVVVGFLGYLAYQPSLLRLAMLWSFASPSQGESLNWAPEPSPPEPAREVRRPRAPDEWRLSPGYSAQWAATKAPSTYSAVASGSVTRDAWPRFSANPWQWQNDVAPTRSDTLSVIPPQKSASTIRVGEHEIWPDTAPELAQAAPTPVATPQAMVTPVDTSLPPLLPPLPSQGAGAAAPTAVPTIPSIPAVATPAPDITGGVLALPPLGALSTAAPAAPATPAAPTSPSVQPAARQPQPAAPMPEAPQVDWKNTEITGPIPGAYLTIYPKLKFVGLCVPGQGYVRKYNQIGVPSDLASPKMEARDGRTPYGRYYIADRHRDADGPRLYLSWPSPEDAQRIGLDAGRTAEVVNAWRRQTLPPQDTAAGGGVGLNGLRNWVEVTEGGFALEEPHMEEIFTALPDKAWVFIQE